MNGSERVIKYAGSSFLVFGWGCFIFLKIYYKLKYYREGYYGLFMKY